MAPPAPDPSIAHVARRLTFGPTNELMDEIATAGTDAWIDRQLAWESIDDSAVEAIVSAWPRALRTAAEITALGDVSHTRGELAAATAARAVWGRRQLHELLVDFWSNHFNIDSAKEPSLRHLPTHDREVIRRLATGRFTDLLLATAKSPAMLLYLDQATSRVDGGRLPIENYARELLELHTVGVDGGYDEQDVKETAWLLSGWTVASRTDGGFTFRRSWHAPGPLATGGDVLGWRPGQLTDLAAGESLLTHLAHLPATATRLAHKLAVRFIGEHVEPDAAVVRDAAAVYLANDTAIAPTVRSLLRSDAFRDSAGMRLRRPFEYLVSLARSTGLRWDPSIAGSFQRVVSDQLGLLGQVPFAWPTPDGYPDRDDHWATAGAMVTRWNLASSAANDFDTRARRSDTSRIVERIVGAPAPPTFGDAIDRTARAVLGESLPASTRAAILDAVGAVESTAWTSSTDGRSVVALVLQTPENQVR